jgi:hypothetical protein
VLALFALTVPLASTRALASPAGWFGSETVKGNGVIKKQNRDLAHFTGVSLELGGQLELRIGNTEDISIESDDNLLALIETVVEHGTLRIRAARKDLNLEPRTLKFVVQARQIERLAVDGSGSIDAPALRATKLQLAIGGSGSINVKNAECESVQASIGGSGNLNLAGTARQLSVSIGGSGDVRAAQMKAQDVRVSIGGSGRATVWARDALRASIAGSGDVNYYGDPEVSSAAAGSGVTKRLGPAPL